MLLVKLMKRDFYLKLEEWKNNNILTPLMVVGARQVGKTYIIDKFCKDNFNDYIYINLMDNPRIIKIFEQDDNIENKILELKLELKRDIKEDTVIFIDEVQESEDIISSLKYFCESDFPYKIIVAGSLLGVKLKRFKKSFPVGKVLIEYMYPMSFKEYLIAIGDEQYIPIIKDCYKQNKPMKDFLHTELIKEYQTFLCLGGMPQMVLEYVNNKDRFLFEPNIILKSIIDSYISDMGKYTSNIYETNKIERIYRNIPSQLAKENKKYQFSKIEKNARFRDYETAFEWLLASRLIIPCYLVNRFETPLKAFINDTDFKIYLSDVGLLVELLNIPLINILKDEDFMFKGAMVENYVATELVKNNIDLFYYNKPQVMDIDFLIDVSEGVIPIEVKANDNVKSNSLNKFMEKEKCKLGIRISSKNFGLENKIKSIPLYAVFCIEK